MTNREARLARLAYIVLGTLAAAIGISMIIATLWASIEGDPNPFPLFKPLMTLLELLNSKIYIIGWLKDLVLNTQRYPELLNPFYVGGFLLMLLGAYLFQNARRLKSWMVTVKTLLAQESMLNSLRPNTSSNTIGDVHGGRDVRIKQEIANYVNHRPDRPLTALIIALIGAVVSAVLGPMVGIWLAKG